MCHLHTHSEYSALDGLATIQEIIERAKALNHDSVAITDHGNMSMALEFYSKAKKTGINPIIGMEAYQVYFGQPMSIRDKNFNHLLLLAKNNTGYRNLSAIATISQLEGYYYKPRIDYGILERYAEGLITTTGCMAAEIPTLIREGNLSEAETLFRWYQNVFKDDFYVELQDHNIPELLDQNKVLLEWAKKYGVIPIVTNDSHYAVKEHASPHDIMLCIQTGSKVGDKERMRFNNESYYMKADEEMPYQEFLHNNKDVAKKCKVSFGKESYKIPILFKDSFQVLRDNVLRLAPEKYEEIPLARLEFELDVIKKMGFSDYFLIVFDLINFCKKNNIYYSIRGSAAGSVVSYVLDITKVEPISNELFFERFLNPDRISMPDIDMDFADDQRHLVVEYTLNKYGVENVASIITFGTMATKAALKDSCRVLNIPLKEAEGLTKLVPSGNKATDLKGCMGIKEFSTLIEGNTLLKKAYEYALVLENRIRNTGVHAAGIVISDKPIKDYVPLSRVQDSKLSERLIGATQFEMKHLEDLGLLKMDYLGLSTLTVVRKTIKRVNEKYGKSYTFDNVPISHPKIWELLKSGDTIGIFQLSSDGMTDVIKKMQPKKYEHIVAAVALYRPGPMDYIPLYIKRLHGEEFIYDHPILEPILKETYGILIFQEQIMKMSVEFAGYTLAEADFLRKAIGKKDIEGLKAQEQKFIAGALKKGNKEDIAKKLWNDILPSARYSFNKAHAAVYAQLTCKTAYLKAMYPSEFIAEYIQSELSKDAGDSIPDIKRHVKLYPPTYKDVFCVPFEDGVKIGTSAIKGISLEFCERIAEFKGKTISEFFEEVRPSKKQLEILINSGVLDSLWDRYSLSSSKEKILKHIEDIKSPKKKIKGFFDTEEDFGKLKFEKELITFSEKELMDMEFETFGFYISKSPQELALDLFKSNKTTEVKLGKNILFAGTVNPKYTQTKNGDEMAFLDLTDVYGKVSITVFPKQLIKYKDLIKSGKPLTVYCKTQDYNGKVSLLAEEISDKDISEFYPECFYVPPPSEGLVCFYKYGDEPYDIMAKINTLMVKSGNLEVSVFDVENSRYIDFDFRTGINPLELYNLLK